MNFCDGDVHELSRFESHDSGTGHKGSCRRVYIGGQTYSYKESHI
jgi:hypothetical protein